jgi:protein LSM14
MSENQPYIGAPVTLISSLDVRYEGTLFTIDPNESTVALQNVRCLGTENRQSGSKAIPPSETVYEFIIFRGENIKSINIAEEKFGQKNELNDPSILKLGPKGRNNNYSEPKREKPRRDSRNGGGMPPFTYDRGYRRDPAKYRPRQDYDNRGYRDQGRRQYQNRGYRNDYDRRDNRRYDGGRYQNRRQQNRRRRQDNRQPQGPRHNPGDAKFLTGRDSTEEKITMNEEFDFEKATFDKANVLTEEKKAEPAQAEAEKTEETDKKEEEASNNESNEKAEDTEAQKSQEEEKKEESPEPAAAPAQKPFEYKYNPEKSFFDDLDLVDRSNMDFKARRKIDAQTFGEEASTYKVRRRRRRGGNNRRRRPRYNRY